MMKVLAIGNTELIEELWRILENSEEVFDIPIVVLEDNTVQSEFLRERCQVISLADIMQLDMRSYDLIFLCSDFQERIKKILVEILGEECVAKRVHNVNYALRFYPANVVMGYIKKQIHERDHVAYASENVSVGAFTYGVPKIWSWGG